MDAHARRLIANDTGILQAAIYKKDWRLIIKWIHVKAKPRPTSEVTRSLSDLPGWLATLSVRLATDN